MDEAEEQRLRLAAPQIASLTAVQHSLEEMLHSEPLTAAQRINALSEIRKTIELKSNLNGTLRISQPIEVTVE